MAAAILKAKSTTAGENTIIRTVKYACFAVYNWRQNCWDIVLKWDNLREQNSPHPSPREKLVTAWSMRIISVSFH